MERTVILLNASEYEVNVIDPASIKKLSLHYSPNCPCWTEGDKKLYADVIVSQQIGDTCVETRILFATRKEAFDKLCALQRAKTAAMRRRK